MHIKKEPLLMTVISVVLLIVCNVVEAHEYFVDATKLRIRADSTQKSTIIGNLQKGDTVNVLFLSSDEQWGAIKQPKKGWVYMKYLKPVELKPADNATSDDNLNFGKWIITRTWFRTFVRVFFLLGAVEFIILLFFAIPRLRILDLLLRYAYLFACFTNFTLSAPIFLYIFPTCMAIMVYYFMLYSRFSARDNFFKIIKVSISLFLVFLLIMTIIRSEPFGGFLLRGVFTAVVNYYLFGVLYFGALNHECPYCHCYARHKKVNEVVKHISSSTTTSNGSETFKDYNDNGVPARLKEDYKEQNTYKTVYSDVSLKCKKCRNTFIYEKARFFHTGSHRQYDGKRYIEENGGARHYV